MSLLPLLLLACTDPGKPDPGDTGRPDDSGDVDSGDTDSGDTDSGDTDSGDTDSGDTDEPGEPKGEAFFATDRIHTVALELDDEDIGSLNTDPKTYVEGHVTLDGTRVERVGVRIKGSSTAQTFSGKPSLKIDLNRYVDQDYEGLELLQLHGLIIDTTQVHEAMGWKVAEMAGLPYSRVAYARLTVNDVDYGLYAHVEAHDDEWMDRTWADGDEGRLYEGGYPLYPESFDHADFVRREVRNFDLEEGEDVDLADLTAAVDEILDPETPDWYGRVNEKLDLEAFARFVAVEGWIGQWDGYAYAANNFRVYVDAGGQAELILSGLDWSFTESGGDWGQPGASLVTKCKRDETCEAALKAAVSDLCTRIDTDALLAERARVWALIEDDVASDPRRPMAMRSVVTAQDGLDDWIAGRSEALAAAWGVGCAGGE